MAGILHCQIHAGPGVGQQFRQLLRTLQAESTHRAGQPRSKPVRQPAPAIPRARPPSEPAANMPLQSPSDAAASAPQLYSRHSNTQAQTNARGSISYFAAASPIHSASSAARSFTSLLSSAKKRTNPRSITSAARTQKRRARRNRPRHRQQIILIAARAMQQQHGNRQTPRHKFMDKLRSHQRYLPRRLLIRISSSSSNARIPVIIPTLLPST